VSSPLRFNQGRNQGSACPLSLLESLERAQQRGITALMRLRRGQQHLAAGNCSLRGFIAKDEAIAPHRRTWRGDRDLAIRSFARRDVVGARLGARTKRNHFSNPFRRADVDADPLMILEPGRRRRPYFDQGVESIARQRHRLVRNHIAPVDRGARRPGQVQGDALSLHRHVGRLVVDFDATDPQQIVTWQAPHGIAVAHFPTHRRAGHDHAVTGRHERAIDRQTKVASRRRCVGGYQGLVDHAPQAGEARASCRGKRHDRGPL